MPYMNQEEYCAASHHNFMKRNSFTPAKAVVAMVAGAGVGSMVAPGPGTVLGALIGAGVPMVWMLGRDAQRADFALTHGAAAVDYHNQDLRKYASEMGREETAQQLLLAQQNKIPLSASQKAFIKNHYGDATDALVKQDPPVGKQFYNLTSKMKNPETGKYYVPQNTKLQPLLSEDSDYEDDDENDDEFDHVALPVKDLAALMANKLKPTIISAMPRVGKGILLAQAWRLAKAKNPALKVWVIDLKAHPDETGYWAGVDHLLSFRLKERPPNDEESISQIEAFIHSWQSDPAAQKLLIFDEQILVKARLPKWYKTYVLSLVQAEGSSGESDGTILWVVMQSPLVADIGLTGGSRSVYNLIALARLSVEDETSATRWMSSARKSGFLPADEIPDDDDFNEAPRGTLAYSSVHGWMALPEYPVPQPLPPPPTVKEPKTQLQDVLYQPKSQPNPLRVAKEMLEKHFSMLPPNLLAEANQMKPHFYRLFETNELIKIWALIASAQRGEIRVRDILALAKDQGWLKAMPVHGRAAIIRQHFQELADSGLGQTFGDLEHCNYKLLSSDNRYLKSVDGTDGKHESVPGIPGT